MLYCNDNMKRVALCNTMCILCNCISYRTSEICRFLTESYCVGSNWLSAFIAFTHCRDQRLEQAKDLSSWSQCRQSTRRTLRRLKEDGFEMLSNLELWRGDIHVIEGKRVDASDKTTCYSN